VETPTLLVQQVEILRVVPTAIPTRNMATLLLEVIAKQVLIGVKQQWAILPLVEQATEALGVRLPVVTIPMEEIVTGMRLVVLELLVTNISSVSMMRYV
jgi:hypothetical protein